MYAFGFVFYTAAILKKISISPSKGSLYSSHYYLVIDIYNNLWLSTSFLSFYCHLLIRFHSISIYNLCILWLPECISCYKRNKGEFVNDNIVYVKNNFLVGATLTFISLCSDKEWTFFFTAKPSTSMTSLELEFLPLANWLSIISIVALKTKALAEQGKNKFPCLCEVVYEVLEGTDNLNWLSGSQELRNECIVELFATFL